MRTPKRDAARLVQDELRPDRIEGTVLRGTKSSRCLKSLLVSAWQSLPCSQAAGFIRGVSAPRRSCHPSNQLGSDGCSSAESGWQRCWTASRKFAITETDGDITFVHSLSARLVVPAQAVDATPSSVLILQCFPRRSDLFGRPRSKPSQGGVPADLAERAFLAFVFNARRVRAECCVDPLKPPR